MNNLPTTISEYFRYQNAEDKDGMLSVLSDEAYVLDRGEDNEELRGKDEIGAWMDKSIFGLNLDTQISDVTENDGSWSIETVATGDFKVSPAKFIYHIKMDQDKISFLDIEFAGSLQK